MEYTELPHRHGNDRDLSRLEHCMQEAESFQAVAGLCRLLSDANRVRIFWLLCHCEECVVNLAALVGMSSPAASHHLRQLKDSGLVVSRRIGKEVYYRAADTEVAGLLHQVIERTVEVTCPREEAMPHAPHLPPVDAHAGEHAAGLTPQQREIIHQVHQLLTENLDSRITIEQLSRRFLMNPSTMKELFKAEYGSSIAAHIRQHRMERRRPCCWSPATAWPRWPGQWGTRARASSPPSSKRCSVCCPRSSGSSTPDTEPPCMFSPGMHMLSPIRRCVP